jgi:DNA repair exonuclease SbcCD ATPase subunit
MIIFEDIQWSNFLSTGNNPTKIFLNRSSSTLIVGQNGAGKSTLLDALSFGLFGKAHRNIKKDQLINSVNKKNALVEVNFKADKTQYKIVRGIRPTIFEVWQNGVMINQDSTSRDYQKLLEQTILKFNHKSFHQIIVLGSSSFIPFMQLPTNQRREIIEDLLDITIFSVMREGIKENLGKLREQLADNDYQYKLIKEKIKLKHDYISEVAVINDDIIKSKRTEQDTITDGIVVTQKENNILKHLLDTNKDRLETELQELNKQKTVIMKRGASINAEINQVVKEAKFYENNDNCPTCHQDLDSELKETHINKAQTKAKALSVDMTEVSTREKSNSSNTVTISTELNKLYDNQNKINSNNSIINNQNYQIETIEKQINDLLNKDPDVSKSKIELNKLEEYRSEIESLRYTMLENRLYNEAIYELLKDTGIKTKIIKQYLPVINKLINNYLQVMDFFVSFNLDETFSENIKSRHRDIFNYDSFSEGEKARIDLSLLFTWRQIAKMKNSISCNLLILDETFDSSLDFDGTDNLTKILDTLDTDTNTFVISHKADVLEGKFRNKIEFVKDKNFSRIV